jgi:transcriptional regulator with XRE-family HTH domain
VRIDGKKLKKLREGRLWSREDLSGRSGVSADQIGRIERGVTESPHMRTVRGLVEALGVEPTELVRKDDDDE